ncbi:MAG: glycosyltransferase family 2 protein, partial [Peptococcaceae bacterium]|nr:glycosyltransferase family 2 protein [Peptococcaceae bacterium]
MAFDFTKEPGRVLLDRQQNTEGTPLVSIITPYYNAGTYFEQTFNCVMNQTFPWFEWIIVNDGSTKQDDVALLEQLAATDARVKVLHKDNGGISAARNMGVQHSNADIIIPLDADDLIQPNFVEYLYWGLYFHSDATWCYTDSVGFGTQEYVWSKEFSSAYMKVNNIMVCTAAIRKEAFLNVGGYPEKQHAFDEDWALWLLMLQKGYYPVHLSSTGFWYRRTDKGMLATVHTDKELEKKSNAIMKQLADGITKEVQAVEYPRASKANQFIRPKVSTFDRKVFKNHDKINVMMLIPWMEMGGADLFNLDVVKRIDKERFEISILSTVAGESTW